MGWQGCVGRRARRPAACRSCRGSSPMLATGTVPDRQHSLRTWTCSNIRTRAGVSCLTPCAAGTPLAGHTSLDRRWPLLFCCACSNFPRALGILGACGACVSAGGWLAVVTSIKPKIWPPGCSCWGVSAGTAAAALRDGFDSCSQMQHGGPCWRYDRYMRYSDYSAAGTCSG
jgi:hypothetical protein